MANPTTAQIQAILDAGGTTEIGVILYGPGGTAPNQSVIDAVYAANALVGPETTIIADRARLGVYSVKDYGAKGDGTTDDYAAGILAAYAACPSGGALYFPSGSYNLNGHTLAVTKQIDIIGAGARNTIIYQTGNVDAFALNVGGGSRISNMTMRDLMILAKTDQSAGAGIHVGNIGESHFRDITISNAGGGRLFDGVRGEDGANIYFHGVQVKGAANANWHLEPVAATQNMIEWYWDNLCRADSGAGHGMLWYNNQLSPSSIEGMHVGHMSIYNNAGDGVHAFKNSTGFVKNIHIEGAIIDSNKGFGGSFDAVAGQAISNLFIDDAAFSANTHISITPSGPFNDGLYLGAVQDWHANGGNYSLSGKSAIQVNGATNGFIANGTFYDNNSGNNTAATAPTHAIAVMGTTQYLKIHGCQLFNDTGRAETLQNGVWIASTALDVEVSNNYLPHLNAAVPFTDNTAGASRVQMWGNRIAGTNSDGQMISRGLNVYTKSGGGLNDTLRLTDTANSKQSYLRCNNGRVEVVNSGFSEVVATVADQNGHRYKSQSAVPTYAVGAAAGTAPTVAAMTGTDESMTATLTTGTATTTGATILTVTFKAAWDSAPNNVQVAPKNSAAAATTGAAKPYVTNITTTGFILQSNTTALAVSTQYVWGLLVS